MNNVDLGRHAERQALAYLNAQGYAIITRNYKTKFGEVDIIAKDKDVYCFVEVKARRSQKFGLPEEAVTKTKQKQIIKAALAFLKNSRLMESHLRFDVVSIIYCADGPIIRLIKDAFILEENSCYV